MKRWSGETVKRTHRRVFVACGWNVLKCGRAGVSVFRCFIFDIGKHLCHICILRHTQQGAHTHTYTHLHMCIALAHHAFIKHASNPTHTYICKCMHLYSNNISNSISLRSHVFVCVCSSAIMNYFGESHLIGLKLILLTCTLSPPPDTAQSICGQVVVRLTLFWP